MLKIFARLILLTLAVAGGRFAYDKALDLPPFALKSIDVTGNWDVSPDSILKITSLDLGKSIYKQDLPYAASRLMHQPGVVQCSIKEGWLNKISIEIKVAEPALLVNCAKLNALSREGMILPMKPEMPILPLVSGRKFENVQCYDHLRDPDIAYAINAYDNLMKISPTLCARLSEINLGGDGALHLFFSPAGTEILVNKGDLKNSLKRLSVLADSGLVVDTTMFDLRYGPVMVESSTKEGTL